MLFAVDGTFRSSNGFFASRNLIYSGLLYELEPKHGWSRSLSMVPYLPAKGLLNFLRTVPEILCALIFVFIVGLGPFAGVLALRVHTGGVLGKLFGEVLDDVDQQTIEALPSTGANRLQILLWDSSSGSAPVHLLYAVSVGGKYPRGCSSWIRWRRWSGAEDSHRH